MAFDYFTLQALSYELCEKLTGQTIARAGFSPHHRWNPKKPIEAAPTRGASALGIACSREWHFVFELGPEGFINCEAGPISSDFVFGGYSERYLEGAKVESVIVDKRDRILNIRLVRLNAGGESTYGVLRLELIPPFIQAVLVSERTQKIIGLWPARKKPGVVNDRQSSRELQLGGIYLPPVGRRRILPGEDLLDVFSIALREELPRQGGDWQVSLQRLLVGADRGVAAELLHRAGLQKSVIFQESSVRQLFDVAVELYGTHNFVRDAFVFCVEGRRMVSSLEPRRPVSECHKFGSVLDAIDQWRTAVWQARSREQQFVRARRLLTRELRQVRRAREAVERDLDETDGADELLRKGSILLAHLHEVPHRADQILLPDSFCSDPDVRVSIKLDQSLTAAENAARFLKKASKLKKRRCVLPARLDGVRVREANLQHLIDHLLAAIGKELPPGVREWMDERESKQTRIGKARDRVHPRRYCTSSGWGVWVGRNQRENDQLTHRLAAQDDFWFHASGYPGSHVILRREGRKEEPSVRTVEEAAAIAAYWSKGRSSKKVPVVYTLVKHVSKPRGGTPGLAVLKREKTVIIAPALLPIFKGED